MPRATTTLAPTRPPAFTRRPAARMPVVALSSPNMRKGGMTSIETLIWPKSCAARAAFSSVTRAPFVVRLGVIPRARAASAMVNRSFRVSASPPPIATWKTRARSSASRRASQPSSGRSLSPRWGVLSW